MYKWNSGFVERIFCCCLGSMASENVANLEMVVSNTSKTEEEEQEEVP